MTHRGFASKAQVHWTKKLDHFDWIATEARSEVGTIIGPKIYWTSGWAGELTENQAIALRFEAVGFDRWTEDTLQPRLLC